MSRKANKAATRVTIGNKQSTAASDEADEANGDEDEDTHVDIKMSHNCFRVSDKRLAHFRRLQSPRKLAQAPVAQPDAAHNCNGKRPFMGLSSRARQHSPFRSQLKETGVACLAT